MRSSGGGRYGNDRNDVDLDVIKVSDYDAHPSFISLDDFGIDAAGDGAAGYGAADNGAAGYGAADNSATGYGAADYYDGDHYGDGDYYEGSDAEYYEGGDHYGGGNDYDGGNYVGGAMDETDAEGDPYVSFRAAPAKDSGEVTSILHYVADK